MTLFLTQRSFIKLNTLSDLNKMDPSVISKCDTETQAWLHSALPEDIANAICLGKLGADKIREASRRQQIPVNKGVIGERTVMNILKSKYNDVTNVSKTSKSGDITLVIDHLSILVEVKNYANPVPTAEVDKFVRDLETTNVSGGLFISLETSITKITTDITMRHEYVNGRIIPCVYIVGSDPHCILVAVGMITSQLNALTVVKKHNTEFCLNTNITENTYKLSDHIDSLSKARYDLQASIGDINTKLIKASTVFAAVENGFRNVHDDLRNELFYSNTTCDLVTIELKKNAAFCKQKKSCQDLVIKLIRAVSRQVYDKKTLESVWSLSGNKCVSALGGVGFCFLSSRTDVILHIPIGVVAMVALVSTPGIMLQVSKTIDIGLNEMTEVIITDILTGKYLT